MLRRLGIRGKVLAALSVPVLVLFVMAGALSWSSIQQAQTARTVTTLLNALQASRDLAVALAPERRAAVAVAQDQDLIAEAEEAADGTADLVLMNEEYAADRAALLEARNGVTAAVEDLFSLLNLVDLGALDPRVSAEANRLRESINDLSSIRGRVDEADPPPLTTVLREYSAASDAVIAFPRLVGDALSDRELAAILSAHSLVTKTADDYSREQALGSELLLLGEPDPELMVQVAAYQSISDVEHPNAIAAVEALGLGDDVVMPDLGASATGFQSFDSYRLTIALGNRQSLEFSREPDYTIAANTEIANFTAIQDTLRQAATERADVTASSATRNAFLTLGMSLAAVALSVIAALAIARQIIRPLQRLTQAAGTVRDELPHLVEQVAIPGQGPDLRLTRIPVDSRDEIGRLATAFNEVNATTIEVAQEQAALRASIAEMFVNVARRDQVLLNRQLSFIDALERSEEDPKTLADLFRLDHLATRMRRNAESLLVLAGIDTGRRLREALPTSDVIRTASSEIEHYERIQLDLPVDPFMLGHTALPAAHMLAEVLENATVFSDPGTPVHVSTGIDETHVIITIHDQGLGMSVDELAEANMKIRATSAGDVLGSQRLGLFVVGRIATRLGSTVEVARGPDDRGTLVTVRMPLVLFVDPGSIPITPPTQHGRVETFVAPEEAAAVVHDAAYAPIRATVQDVAAGAYGSAENPAEEVDITALIDGTTGQGLPRRRATFGDVPTWDLSGGDAASAPAIPLMPSAEALAGAAGTADDTEVWQPPFVQPSAPLSPRRRTEPTAGGVGQAFSEGGALPTRTPTTSASGLPMRTATGSQPPVPQSSIGAPTASGLPSRRRTGPGAPTAREAVDTAAATGPVNVEGRTAVFQGFRSRRAELAAAAIHERGAGSADDQDTGTTDAVERLAVAATGAAAFFNRSAAAPAEPARGEPARGEPARPGEMVIPALVDDDEDLDDQTLVPGAAQQAPVQAEPTTAEPEPWQPEVPAWPSTVASRPDAVRESATPTWPPARRVPLAAAEPPAERPAPEPSAPERSPWATEEAPEAPMWSTVAPEPAAEAPFAGQLPPPYEPFPYHSPEDFTELIQGPTRRSMRQIKRRGWFRRSRPEPEAYTAPAYAPPPTAAPVSPPAARVTPPVAPVAPAAPVRSEPVRQSAWGPSSSGSHVVEEPADQQTVPVWRPPVPADPAPPSRPERSGTPGPVPAVERRVAQRRSEAPAAPRPAAPAGPSGSGDVWMPESTVPRESWPQHEAAAPTVAMPSVAPSAPATAPAVAGRPEAPRSPASYGGATSFTPQSGFGFDDEMTSMLAQRADIAQQALAELNQLSTYRPQAVAGSAASALARRTPGNIPAAPAIVTSATPRPARDANQVRSLITSFQSGTSRGRQLAEGGVDAAARNAGDNGLAGSEVGPDARGEPVTTPDADLNPRDTAW